MPIPVPTRIRKGPSTPDARVGCVCAILHTWSLRCPRDTYSFTEPPTTTRSMGRMRSMDATSSKGFGRNERKRNAAPQAMLPKITHAIFFMRSPFPPASDFLQSGNKFAKFHCKLIATPKVLKSTGTPVESRNEFGTQLERAGAQKVFQPYRFALCPCCVCWFLLPSPANWKILLVYHLLLNVARRRDEEWVILTHDGEDALSVGPARPVPTRDLPLGNRGSAHLRPVLTAEPLQRGFGVGRSPHQLRPRLDARRGLQDEIAPAAQCFLALGTSDGKLAFHGHRAMVQGLPNLGFHLDPVQHLHFTDGDRLPHPDRAGSIDHNTALPRRAELLPLDVDTPLRRIAVRLRVEFRPLPGEIDHLHVLVEGDLAAFLRHGGAPLLQVLAARTALWRLPAAQVLRVVHKVLPAVRARLRGEFGVTRKLDVLECHLTPSD